jgi:hypothetical protein
VLDSARRGGDEQREASGVGSRFKVRKDNINSLVVEYPDGGFMR